MKKDIHPEVHPVIFVDVSSNDEFVTSSTLTSEETRDVNGVSHYVVKVEVSSASHPFYTGKQRFVDSAGQVDKFKKRAERVEKAKATRGTSKKKRKKAEKENKQSAKEALKAALND